MQILSRVSRSSSPVRGRLATAGVPLPFPVSLAGWGVQDWCVFVMIDGPLVQEKPP